MVMRNLEEKIVKDIQALVEREKMMFGPKSKEMLRDFDTSGQKVIGNTHLYKLKKELNPECIILKKGQKVNSIDLFKSILSMAAKKNKAIYRYIRCLPSKKNL